MEPEMMYHELNSVPEGILELNRFNSQTTLLTVVRILYYFLLFRTFLSQSMMLAHPLIHTTSASQSSIANWALQGYKWKENIKKSKNNANNNYNCVCYYLKFRKQLRCLTHCLVVVLLNMHPHLESLNTLLDYNDTTTTKKFTFQFGKRELFAPSLFYVFAKFVHLNLRNLLNKLVIICETIEEGLVLCLVEIILRDNNFLGIHFSLWSVGSANWTLCYRIFIFKLLCHKNLNPRLLRAWLKKKGSI